jgi:hypothetical protein
MLYVREYSVHGIHLQIPISTLIYVTLGTYADHQILIK